MLQTLHGQLNTPVFLPDATYGSIKSVSFKDVEDTKTPAIVTTTLHLENKLGSEYVRDFGGLHKFFNWNKPILTDSGGFQVFSLIYRRNNKDNRISDVGCSFIDPLSGRSHLLTPESSQIIQHNLGSDICVVLDEPVIHDGPISQARKAVERTTLWAKRSKQKFLELNDLTEKDFNDPSIKRPLLVAVIQGGNNFELRKRSADSLLEIGFDIYGFGGLPLHNTFSWKNDAPVGFHHELLEYVTGLVPKDTIKYGLGIGTPDDISYLARLGWEIFDTVLPTRNARHGLLYVSKGSGDKQHIEYDTMHIRTDRYKFDDSAVDPKCDCITCRTTSRAYLRYLLRIEEPAGYRLASIHNLRFYSKLMEDLQNNL